MGDNEGDMQGHTRFAGSPSLIWASSGCAAALKTLLLCSQAEPGAKKLARSWLFWYSRMTLHGQYRSELSYLATT